MLLFSFCTRTTTPTSLREMPTATLWWIALKQRETSMATDKSHCSECCSNHSCTIICSSFLLSQLCMREHYWTLWYVVQAVQQAISAPTLLHYNMLEGAGEQFNQIETTQQNASSHSNPMAKRLFWLCADAVKPHTHPTVGAMWLIPGEHVVRRTIERPSDLAFRQLYAWHEI